MKYRKKPVVIEAMQYTGTKESLEELEKFITGKSLIRVYNGLGILTLEGVMCISKDDYIIRGVQGEYYPCKPDIFAVTYEEVK